MTQTPDSYHKIVDCQYACPAHTPVPEYIRLIAQGRFGEAYILNQKSNVFPGILGRICDRPCEPACRRSRVEEEPVAICRLKRAAADHRNPGEEWRPDIPIIKNGKKIALIGSGPASLTVASELMPLGYECHMFEKDPKPGGAMAYQVPSFRLPGSVLEEEVGRILSFGVETFFNHEVTSLEELLPRYDALFVGSGAPQGRDLPGLPGRSEAPVQVGLDFLANIHFGHKKTGSEKILVIGGGNTAMDCARTALRLAGVSEVVVATCEGAQEMFASPWEIEDAREEGVQMVHHLLPQGFVFGSGGEFLGVEFQPLSQAYDGEGRFSPKALEGVPPRLIPCGEVILAIGQGLRFSFIEKDLGIEFLENGRPKLNSYQSTLPKVFFGGDGALGPTNIITAVAQGKDAARGIHLFCHGKTLETPALKVNLVSQKITLAQWGYDALPKIAQREKNPREHKKSLELEAEKGFDQAAAQREARRCLNCDMQTVLTPSLCIECDSCVDICPVNCLTILPELPGETEETFRLRLTRPATNTHQDVYREPLPQTGRLMAKDEDLCLHCGLCAERCPTGAWDMKQSFFYKDPLCRG
jgi:formate dehydrogenase beta subunit